MAAQVTGARNVSPTGHLGEQLGGADESAGPADEILEDLPFGWSEADLALRRGHGPAGDVDDSTSDPDSRRGADPAWAPQDGTQAGKEVCSVERLGDVVVNSGVGRRALGSNCGVSGQHAQHLRFVFDDENPLLRWRLTRRGHTTSLASLT